MSISEQRICQNCKAEFRIEPEDFDFYQKIQVPAPRLCPECRQQRRMAWRNDYNFFPRECNLCHERILSIYSQDKPMPVYCPKCWWSDDWDPSLYSQEIDWGRSFFDQYKELLDKVPALAVLNDNNIASINCPYTNYFALGKDCYMVINSWKVEECMYSACLVGVKNAVDSAILLNGGEHLYHAINVSASYRCRYVFNSAQLLDSAYCFDCRSCSNCFMCVGLRGKQYCFQNRQLSKEDYEKNVRDYQLSTWTGSERARTEFEQFVLKFPRKHASILNCSDCTGDYLTHSKNSKHCYITVRVENSKYFERGDTIRDSYDCLSGGEQELCYESINPDNSYLALFTSYCHKNSRIWYSDSCQSSEDLFGCVGFKHARYRIFNKQYSEDEYPKIIAKLKDKMTREGEFGEFFPIRLSLFGYNESVAQDEFPISGEHAVALGYPWQKSFTKTEGRGTLAEIPDDINQTASDITSAILICNSCQRNYRIISQELAFYRQNQIPIPRDCFFCRLKILYKERGPVHLWFGKCQCVGGQSRNGVYANTTSHFHGDSPCPNEFETSYAPDRPEIIYCEQCYNAEVA